MGRSSTKGNNLLIQILGFIVFSYIYPVLVTCEWYLYFISMLSTYSEFIRRNELYLHLFFGTIGLCSYAALFYYADSLTIPVDLNKYTAVFITETKPTWRAIVIAYYNIAAALVSNLASTAYKVSSIYVLIGKGSPILVISGGAWFFLSLFAWTESR